MSDTKKVTRPKEFIPDMEQVEKLCRLNCTDAELAAYFGFCRKTIERERRDNPEFDAAIERGKSYGKLSLRRKQVALAEEGNATMLIWLGKQYMGQRDKTDQNISGNLGLTDLTEEQLDDKINQLKSAIEQSG